MASNRNKNQQFKSSSSCRNDGDDNDLETMIMNKILGSSSSSSVSPKNLPSIMSPNRIQSSPSSSSSSPSSTSLATVGTATGTATAVTVLDDKISKKLRTAETIYNNNTYNSRIQSLPSTSSSSSPPLSTTTATVGASTGTATATANAVTVPDDKISKKLRAAETIYNNNSYNSSFHNSLDFNVGTTISSISSSPVQNNSAVRTTSTPTTDSAAIQLDHKIAAKINSMTQYNSPKPPKPLKNTKLNNIKQMEQELQLHTNTGTSTSSMSTTSKVEVIDLLDKRISNKINSTGSFFTSGSATDLCHDNNNSSSAKVSYDTNTNNNNNKIENDSLGIQSKTLTDNNHHHHFNSLPRQHVQQNQNQNQYTDVISDAETKRRMIVNSMQSRTVVPIQVQRIVVPQSGSVQSIFKESSSRQNGTTGMIGDNDNTITNDDDAMIINKGRLLGVDTLQQQRQVTPQLPSQSQSQQQTTGSSSTQNINDASAKRRTIIGSTIQHQTTSTPAVVSERITSTVSDITNNLYNNVQDTYTRISTVSNNDNYHIDDLELDEDYNNGTGTDSAEMNDDNTKHSKIIDIKPSSKEFDEEDDTSDLVVAKLITGIDGTDHFYDDDNIPSAEQYDPNYIHAKNIAMKRRRSNQRKILFCIILLIIITISTVFGILSSQSKKMNKNSNNTTTTTIVQEPLHPRLQVGIQQFLFYHFPLYDIHKLDISNQLLLNNDNPFTKAMKWILYNDTQQLVPSTNKTFLQRFIVTHLYYQTTIKSDWFYCHPATTTNNNHNIKSANNFSSYKNKNQCHQLMFNKFNGLQNVSSANELWLSKLSECHWSGNVCDDHGNLIKLSLVGLGLNGPFPDMLDHLPFLDSVQLSSNNLTGTLPESSMLKYKYLVKLVAPSNQLDGTVPVSFYQNARIIHSIQLYFNKFNNINIDNLPTDIKEIMFGGSNYNQSLNNTQIERLPSLSMIDLSNTKLRGTIPLAIWKLPFIFLIEFTQNFLTGTIPKLPPPPELQRIHWEMNQLTGSIPNELVGTSDILIDTLLLSNNKLVGTIPNNISNLYYLDEIKLDMMTGIYGTIPSGLGKLKRLTDVSFVGTSLNGTVPVSLCNQRSKALKVVRANCLIIQNNKNNSITMSSQIICPVGCCTTCCDSNGKHCVNNK